MGALGAAIALLTGGGAVFLGQEKFGALPEGEELLRIKASPNYVDGEFRNLIPRPVLSNGSSFAGSFLNFLMKKKDPNVRPSRVPCEKPHFHALQNAGDVLVWLGHSSFYLQLNGKRILIDPVLSDYASPVPFSVRAFPGSTVCSARDFPPIDCLIISHDHWDHLDYDTVTALRENIGHVVCPLGAGSHFLRWGFERGRILEADWGETLNIGEIRIHVVTASHYSGRSLTRNKTLWAGFMLEALSRRIFFSGDSGYGPHFADIGRRFSGVDLALLDSGQYNENWKYIHMTPEEAVQAALDLGAKSMLPAHIGRFALAYHPWNEPFRRAYAAAQNANLPLLTPVIGQAVRLEDPLPALPRWWEG